MRAFCSPKDGSYPHDVAVVEDIVRQQGEGGVTLVPYTRVDDPTGQEGARLDAGERTHCFTCFTEAVKSLFLVSP